MQVSTLHLFETYLGNRVFLFGRCRGRCCCGYGYIISTTYVRFNWLRLGTLDFFQVGLFILWNYERRTENRKQFKLFSVFENSLFNYLITFLEHHNRHHLQMCKCHDWLSGLELELANCSWVQCRWSFVIHDVMYTHLHLHFHLW